MTCTYNTHGTLCSKPATHYVYSEYPYELSQIGSTVEQVRSMAGVGLVVARLDAHGKQVLDANNRPIFDPVLLHPEFCLQHAEVVCDQRNAHLAHVAPLAPGR